MKNNMDIKQQIWNQVHDQVVAQGYTRFLNETYTQVVNQVLNQCWIRVGGLIKEQMINEK